MKPELLAPCGDTLSFEAALNNGADAVYLGLSDFNARRKAQNFDESNIRDTVRRAHLFGLKVYLTLNTLVKNSEFKSMLKTARCAVEAKIDAFIVQDLGVAAVLKRCFPNIELHLSTQSGVHNVYGAEVAKELGFERVVLSRETKLKDLARIKAECGIQTEFFVQGALCVAFSGNCYFSSLVKNSSGNRGQCLQLCRLKYAAKDKSGKTADEGYLLSPSDLCLLDSLRELSDAQVDSLKIEGRLRRAGYVAEAVACYREAIDNGYPKDNGTAEARLKKVFSRGEYLKRAYLDKGVADRIINKKAQNHQGIVIGEVLGTKPFKDIFEIQIRSKRELHTGDGLKFTLNNEECGSLGVGNVQSLGKDVYKIYSKLRLKTGATVRLILDNKAEEEALNRRRKIAVTLKIKAKIGEKFEVEASSNGVFAMVKSDYVVPPAVNVATESKEIAAQCAKLGDTPFEVERCEVYADKAFVPKSVINAARREAIDKLTQAIVDSADAKVKAAVDEAAIREVICEANGYSADCGASEGKYEDGVIADKYLAVHPDVFSAEQIKSAICGTDKIPAVVLPTIANGEDLELIENVLAALPEVKTLVANNIYGLKFIEKGYEVIGGWGLNAYNNFCVESLRKLGVKELVASVEIDSDSFKFDSLIYRFAGKGYPIMTFAHCPYKTVYGGQCAKCKYSAGLSYSLNDRTFALVRKKVSQCYFELLYDKELSG